MRAPSTLLLLLTATVSCVPVAVDSGAADMHRREFRFDTDVDGIAELGGLLGVCDDEPELSFPVPIAHTTSTPTLPFWGPIIETTLTVPAGAELNARDDEGSVFGGLTMTSAPISTPTTSLGGKGGSNCTRMTTMTTRTRLPECAAAPAPAQTNLDDPIMGGQVLGLPAELGLRAIQTSTTTTVNGTVCLTMPSLRTAHGPLYLSDVPGTPSLISATTTRAPCPTLQPQGGSGVGDLGISVVSGDEAIELPDYCTAQASTQPQPISSVRPVYATPIPLLPLSISVPTLNTVISTMYSSSNSSTQDVAVPTITPGFESIVSQM